MKLNEFYKDKRVFITGHSGFKGSWMCKILDSFGANVMGYSLKPEKESLYTLLKTTNVQSVFSDIRDLKALEKAMINFEPEIVIHMAAQPIVRESYNNPVYTYETNVMGTVNVMEAIRKCKSVKSVINVTTDKVYKNKEWCWGYREDEELNGFDPYSNSKSCSDLVTQCYRNSFLKEIPITICRAGNVIGGGDFAIDRIIPDCYRSAKGNHEILIRNPSSIRPYQHVLEPVIAYLYLAMKQFNNHSYMGEYNIGPDDKDCISTGEIATIFCKCWGNNLNWKHLELLNEVHEANFLKLDCSKIKNNCDWRPSWDIYKAVDKTVEWYKGFIGNEDINSLMINQIVEYLSCQEFMKWRKLLY
ncbi:MAG: CDP-glucose 4,6-dehydratase [Malacoplasma sp.]